MTKLPLAPQRTTPAFAFSMLGRAINECLAARQFGKREMSEVLAFFGADPPQCVFCDRPEVRRWDHLVAVNKGGETVLGNMVPACASCDDSKRDLPFDEWMLGGAANSPASQGINDIHDRIQRIKAYANHYNYEARPLDERLNEQERARLDAIQERLQELRQEIETLIDDYRARTGNT